jgi:hypothetical protein
VKWLYANQHRFPIELVLLRRTDRSIRFSFAGINPVIEGCLHTYGLTIYVSWEGHTWDFIGDWDASPKRFPQGYACTMIRDWFQALHPDQEFSEYHGSRDALWTKEIFDPFLEWASDILAPARWLKLTQYGGATWATLFGDRADDTGQKDDQHRQLVDALIPLSGPKSKVQKDAVQLYLPVRTLPLSAGAFRDPPC